MDDEEKKIIQKACLFSCLEELVQGCFVKDLQ